MNGATLLSNSALNSTRRHMFRSFQTKHITLTESIRLVAVNIFLIKSLHFTNLYVPTSVVRCLDENSDLVHKTLPSTRWCQKFSLDIRFSSSVQAKGITGRALNSCVVRTVFQSNAAPAYYCRYGQATEIAYFPPPLYEGPLTLSKPPFGLVLIHLMYTKTDCTQTRYVATIITFLYHFYISVFAMAANNNFIFNEINNYVHYSDFVTSYISSR